MLYRGEKPTDPTVKRFKGFWHRLIFKNVCPGHLSRWLWSYKEAQRGYSVVKHGQSVVKPTESNHFKLCYIFVGLFFVFITWDSCYTPEGNIVVFDDSIQSTFHRFRPYLRRKTSKHCSVDLSKKRNATTDNPYENSTEKTPFIRGFCCDVYHLLNFPQPLEKSKKEKGKKKKKVLLLRLILNYLPRYSFCLLLASVELVSPCEFIFRKLQSSTIHETSKNWTYHQVHSWEIKSFHPFQLPPTIWRMCAGASQQCEITPQGWQRTGSQPKTVTWIPFNVPHLSEIYCRAQEQLTEISPF